MIKQCPVILNNGAVTVVRYNDIDVQFPYCLKKNVKTLNVEFKNGIYSIVEDIEEAVKENVNSVNEDVKNEQTAKKRKPRKQSKKKVETVTDEK